MSIAVAGYRGKIFIEDFLALLKINKSRLTAVEKELPKKSFHKNKTQMFISIKDTYN